MLPPSLPPPFPLLCWAGTGNQQNRDYTCKLLIRVSRSDGGRRREAEDSAEEEGTRAGWAMRRLLGFYPQRQADGRPRAA